MVVTQVTLEDTTISAVVMALEGIRWAVPMAVEHSLAAVRMGAATARSPVADRMAVVVFRSTLDASQTETQGAMPALVHDEA